MGSSPVKKIDLMTSLVRAPAWASFQDAKNRRGRGKAKPNVEILVITGHPPTLFTTTKFLPPKKYGWSNHHICVDHVCVCFCSLTLWLTFLSIIKPCMNTWQRAGTHFPTLQPYRNKTLLPLHVHKPCLDTHSDASVGNCSTSVWLPSCSQ